MLLTATGSALASGAAVVLLGAGLLIAGPEPGVDRPADPPSRPAVPPGAELLGRTPDASAGLGELPLSIELAVADSEARAGSPVRVRLGISAFGSVERSSLVAVARGGDLRPTSPWLEVPAKKDRVTSASTDLAAIAAGDQRTAELSLIVEPGARGSLALTVIVNDARVAGFATLYFVADERRVFFSPYSQLHAATARLREELSRESLPKFERSHRERWFRRRGAEVEVRIEPPEPGSPDPDPNNSITFRGTASYRDETGAPHPIRRARVEIGGVAFGRQAVLGTTTTNMNGRYGVVVPFASDLSVTVFADNVVARIQDPDTYEIHAISTQIQETVVDDSRVEVNFTAVEDLSMPNNVAFEVLDAVTYFAQFMVQLGEPTPWPILIRFPSTVDVFTVDPGSGIRWLDFQPETASGRFSWATVFQEYAHYVQYLYNLSDHVPSIYRPDVPLCEIDIWGGDVNVPPWILGKGEGAKLAWTEGWARFFAGMAAKELDLESSFSILDIGVDAWMESPLDEWRLGESSLYGVAGALWDIYDQNSEGYDNEVSYPASDLWELTKASQAKTFSEFWASFVRERTLEELDPLGAVLEHFRFATKQLEVNVTLLPGESLDWAARQDVACGASEYSVRTSTLAGSLTWASPWQPDLTLAPNETLRGRMTPSGGVHTYSVHRKNVDTPESGPYFQVPGGLSSAPRATTPAPVDLIVLINRATGMTSAAVGPRPFETKVDRLRRDVAAFLATWEAHGVAGDRVGVIFFDGDAYPLWRQVELLPGIEGEFRVLALVGGALPLVTHVLDPATHPLDEHIDFEDECISLGGALQAAYEVFADESSAGRSKAIVIFTDHSLQNQNPLITLGGAAAIETVGAGTNELISPACENRSASMVMPRQVADPSVPPPKTALVPDGTDLSAHDVVVLTLLQGDLGGLRTEFLDSATLLYEIASQTGGAYVLVNSDGDRDIFMTNALLDRVGR